METCPQGHCDCLLAEHCVFPPPWPLSFLTSPAVLDIVNGLPPRQASSPSSLSLSCHLLICCVLGLHHHPLHPPPPCVDFAGSPPHPLFADCNQMVSAGLPNLPLQPRLCPTILHALWLRHPLVAVVWPLSHVLSFLQPHGLTVAGGALVKYLPAKQEPQEMLVQSLGQEDDLEAPWKQQPTPVFLPGEPHGLRSLLGYSPMLSCV